MSKRDSDKPVSSAGNSGQTSVHNAPKHGASWVDERKLARGDMRVAQAFSKLRTDAAFEEASVCTDCLTERAASEDDEALCEAHLAQAMGMNSAW